MRLLPGLNGQSGAPQPKVEEEEDDSAMAALGDAAMADAAQTLMQHHTQYMRVRNTPFVYHNNPLQRIIPSLFAVRSYYLNPKFV